MSFLRVKNFDKFQHYKDRQPPWIKLHRELLKNYEFSCLQDASKAHLVLIWLLASQLDNRIPNDPDWLKGQLGTRQKIDLSELISAGFLIQINDVADCKQDASNSLSSCKQNLPPSVSVSVLSISESFNSFWKKYPVHKSKADALKAWKQLASDSELLAVILKAIDSQTAERAKVAASGKFIPEWKYPATWLRGRCWEDEPVAVTGESVRHTPQEIAKQKHAEELRLTNVDVRKYKLRPQMRGEPDDSFLARVKREVTDIIAGKVA